MSRRWIVLPAVLLLVVGAALVLADWWICLPDGNQREYVGRSDCGRCHKEEVDLWTGSDHDRAMDLATPETVLGDFDDAKFTHYGVTTTFSRRGDEFFVRTDGADGKLHEFRIKYVFGVRPLQQYLIEFPDGRVQCLGVAWDTQKKRWYHLYGEDPVPAGDELHWTQPSQNWNHMCASCHSTDVHKNFDLADNSFHTTFYEIDVSCETCHGPASVHQKLADSWGVFWDRCVGYGLANLKSGDSHVEIETCAPCHARRRVVYPGFQAGEKFLDYYAPELLDSEMYYADGQILEEDYVYGSFIQSKMYAKGVRCTDCHEPHTARVKTLEKDAPLESPISNRLCTQCHMGSHPAGTYDTPAHHFHPDASQPGTRCVECHMPETKYMVVDPRRDHSMRIPRPDLTIALGIPNACNRSGCHDDQTAEWSEQYIQQWYGKRKGPKHFAYAIAAGRRGDFEGEEALAAVARRQDLSPMVRASAILLLARYPTQSGHPEVVKGLESDAPLIRVAAARGADLMPIGEIEFLRQLVDVQEQFRQIQAVADGNQRIRRLEELDRKCGGQLERLSRIDDPLSETPQTQRTYRRLAPLLSDPLRAVRVEAARVLSRIPREAMPKDDRPAFDTALHEYVTGQLADADQPGAHLNLALVYDNQGDKDQAEQEYLTALRLDPASIQARNNLGVFYGKYGESKKAEQQLRKLIELTVDRAALARRRITEAQQQGRTGWSVQQWKRVQTDAEAMTAQAHYSLGLLLAENEDRMAEAADELGKAARGAPDNARMHYNYGLALQRLDRIDEAEAALKTAVAVDPGSPDYLYALTAFYAQQKRWQQALHAAEQFAARHRADPRGPALLQQMRVEAARAGAGED